MSPAITKRELRKLGEDSIVFVKTERVSKEDLAKLETSDGMEDVTLGQELYCVYNAKGERLALYKNRKDAYEEPLDHDLIPFSVH